MTAYWLVYVQDSIAKELNKTNINMYTVPESPSQAKDLATHCYANRIPEVISV